MLPDLQWSDDFLQRVGPALAIEIVAQLRPAKEILDRFGITPQQMMAIAGTTWFKTMVQEARVALNGDLGAIERIRLKARVALEESLQVPYLLANNADVAPSARLEAVKTLERLAGVVPPEKPGSEGANGGMKFSVVIDLGEGRKLGAQVDLGRAVPPAPPSYEGEVLEGEGEEA